jgi:hypothetical protein
MRYPFENRTSFVYTRLLRTCKKFFSAAQTPSTFRIAHRIEKAVSLWKRLPVGVSGSLSFSQGQHVAFSMRGIAKVGGFNLSGTLNAY